MDKNARNAIERATEGARKLLEKDFSSQLEGAFDVLRSGEVASQAGAHLSPPEVFQRDKIVAAIEHKRGAGMTAVEAVTDYVRDSAFTTLNRFVALKMLEARQLLQECITKGERSAGYREFCGMAPGVGLLPDAAGYRLYIESLFDELSTEMKVLFDRRDAASVLWPKRQTFDALLAILNAQELAGVWGEDETIGWVYQFFNNKEERAKMRDPKQGGSQAPRNSRELAVRNQFFTPRYVVEFLVDNTLGRIWYEMRAGQTGLLEQCEHLVRRPGDSYMYRAKKDPRDLRVLDPACGSGHFLLYAFDLLIAIYEEAYRDVDGPRSEATGKTLPDDYPTIDDLRLALPALVLAHNLHGVDIDPRCAQIAQLSLWMRAQRAFRDFRVGRAERPLIRRSNVVVAEPLATDDKTIKEFLAKLDDVELGRVFTDLVESLKLAGDLGLLLRVEGLITREPRRGQTGDLFAPPEARIRAALANFAEASSALASTRRRLFADDAVQGVGLLEIAEMKFDVVLMNPPFGLTTSRSKTTLKQLYPDDWTDLYAAFFARAIELCAINGRAGAITSSLWLTIKRQESLRARVSSSAALRIVADLGSGVLDDATVDTALAVVEAITPENPHIVSFCRAGAHDSGRRIFEDWQHLAFKGNATFDNFRFLRCWWEVPGREIGGEWIRYDKGGEFQPFFNPTVLVWRFSNQAAENRAFQIIHYDTDAQVLQSAKHWRKPGLCYSRACMAFSPRILASDHVVNDKSIALLPRSPGTEMATLGLLVSTHVEDLLSAFGDHRNIEKGAVASLPLSASLLDDVLAGEAERCVREVWALESTRETSPVFQRPARRGERSEAIARIQASVEKLDAIVHARLFGGTPVVPLGTPKAPLITRVLVERFPEDSQTIKRCLVSYCVGVAFGRWDDACAARELTMEGFDPRAIALPLLPPGARSDRGDSPAILPLDDGDPRDLAKLVSELIDRLEPGLVNISTLRAELTASFFSDHIATYSQSARTAPLYWQLATSSASYSVWLYLHAFTKDTLYKVQNDFVAPKLAFEERRLESLRRELGDSPKTAERKTLAAQDASVDELRAFLEEVKRVAPLWNPNPDDGVIINFAPLWRLVPQHKAWQKELKSKWDELAAGRYDWAHLAMHLWPERVVPKCATDRSLAIAHGLEEAFWVEGTDGKWKARSTPTRPLEELVRERTSPAVKAALKNLLEAPVVSAGNGRGRRRRAAIAASDRGTR